MDVFQWLEELLSILSKGEIKYLRIVGISFDIKMFCF